VEGAKKTKQMFFASLCALAPLRDILYFFTASDALGYNLPPLPGLESESPVWLTSSTNLRYTTPVL